MKKITIVQLTLFVFSLLCFSNSQAKIQKHSTPKSAAKGSLMTSEIRRYKKRFLHKKPRILRVTATAYTSHVGQTDSTPNIAAWGDRLHPDMKVIAVSRDLLKKYGLKHNSKVRIRGLRGEYLVLDKMNKRWRKKIDIYMGKNKKKAFQWGHRKVVIEWTPERV